MVLAASCDEHLRCYEHPDLELKLQQLVHGFCFEDLLALIEEVKVYCPGLVSHCYPRVAHRYPHHC